MVNTLTVRTIADGEHYLSPETFTDENVAYAFYDSTVSRIQREDPAPVEITVALIRDETDDVLTERTFPRTV